MFSGKGFLVLASLALGVACHLDLGITRSSCGQPRPECDLEKARLFLRCLRCLRGLG